MIKIIRSKLIKSIKSRRINIFLLFLVLSFMFLLLTKLTRDYTKTLTFAIEPENVKENYVILTDSTHKLDITLTTYGFKLLRYYLSKPTVKVDLSEMDTKGNQYYWTKNRGIAYLNSQFITNVKLVNVYPDTVLFKFDKNAVKSIPVKLVSEIKYAPGYDLKGDFKLLPDSIKIIGPKLLVDSISTIFTDTLRLEAIRTNIAEPINLVLPDSSPNVVYSHKQLKVEGTVTKFTEGTIDVPVDIINVPNELQINYFPKIVSIIYYTSLTNFNDISSNDFKLECDFKDFVESESSLELKLVKYPENVKNIKLGQKQIEFIISQ